MNEDETLIDEDKALEIALINAQRIYKDLSIYTITAKLIKNQWFVDYDITDPTIAGGGPHYVINAKTGAIESFRYEQ